MARSVPETSSHATALWLLAGLDPTGGAGLPRDGSCRRVRAPRSPARPHGHRLDPPGPRSTGDLRAAARRMRSSASCGSMPPSARDQDRPAAGRAVPRRCSARWRPAASPWSSTRCSSPATAVTSGPAWTSCEIAFGTCPKRHGSSRPTGARRPPSPARPRTTPSWSSAPPTPSAAPASCSRAPPTVRQRVRDVVCLPGQVHVFERPRVAGPDPRGTGCARWPPRSPAAWPRAATCLAAISAAVAWLDVARTRCVPRRRRPRHLPDRRAAAGVR